ncbi:MAG TPA: anthranilate phosphoribosyltransferase [Pseudomonas sp.]|jgi:anthranilate phosphoribosyltransferase|uniref:Anthranilate phosphoribosyltransferase n=1 Tax=Stutzerimonas frequens TaxID=2968969 RepID=A0AA47E5Q8_9GAMM|nr:anthranilate phosphoribosyltransferase [Stutzerimonas frequens]MAL92457.1 anthranilate phosphoribosyltransferase [Pseudomonas sp.]WCR45525.1 anthranilate phosphoribosyltransferase [Stutzerimonas stutzeri]AWT11517.1 anthranilate phosphoribosyltransferase [Stutzerimonas frequens]KZX65369.1 anthranilate phosphoribosyltransferase [Stutzerimonas frequens]MBA4727968.1 anthranilate phosphoribosyltransferase [Pseudomonas sp.]|tara:strand:- start:11929 stop:12975 length:1047 start_codon:yes stop_codon:yes gene_type:complete
MDIKEALNRIVGQLDLTTEEMQAVMRQIMTGQCTDAQIGAFLMGMRMKSETIDEIVGAVQVMRELAEPVRFATEKLVDTCGTGGDGMNIFNVSTAASFVVAAAGGKVAKHGNRAVSGKSGSADLLEAAGVYLDLTPEQVARSVDTVGVGFMFAPAHHGAMKHAAGPRRELGLRTLFNILGPMANPAGVRHQVLGVFSKALCRPMAEVLLRLGSKHVLVVHAQDGLDEISLAAPTHVAELKDGQIHEYDVQPEDFGIKSQSLIGLNVEDAQGSLTLIRDALGRRQSENGQKAADMIVLNAGAALYAADLATSLKQGVEMAHDALSTGLARDKLEELVSFTAVFKQENKK